ncbi:MAG: hypothetical protein AAF690_08275 [Acidobacteriota bacterium]
MSRAARLLGSFTALMATVIACPSSEDAVTSVEVRLEWVTGRAALTERPASVRNDVGVKIEIDQLYLSNFTVQLLPCKETGGDTATASSTNPRFARTLIGVAQAGHGDVLGAAALEEPALEWMGRALPWLHIEAPRVAYCHVHYLVARQPTPEALDRSDRQTSLFVAGRARQGQESIDFVLQTKLAHGAILEIGSPALGDVLVVELQRDLLRLFDGFTLGTFADRDADRLLLRNLIDSAQVKVRRGFTETRS